MHISEKTDGNRNTDITHNPPDPSASYPHTLFHIIYPLLGLPSCRLFVPSHVMNAHRTAEV